MSQGKTVSKWAWRWQAIDYGWLLPLLARLPYALAHKLAKWRGTVHAHLGRDWAELSVGMPYIAERTSKAANLLWPQLDAQVVCRTSRGRHWHGQRGRKEGTEDSLGRYHGLGEQGGLRRLARRCPDPGVDEARQDLRVAPRR